MDIEERGSFYIQRQTIADADGNVTEFFEVGEINKVTGRYKMSNDAGFKTRLEAIQWIEQQAG